MLSSLFTESLTHTQPTNLDESETVIATTRVINEHAGLFLTVPELGTGAFHAVDHAIRHSGAVPLVFQAMGLSTDEFLWNYGPRAEELRRNHPDAPLVMVIEDYDLLNPAVEEDLYEFFTARNFTAIVAIERTHQK